MTNNMSWMFTCIALCAPPALALLLSKRFKRSDLRSIPYVSTSHSRIDGLTGIGWYRVLPASHGNLGVAKTLLVLFVLNLASVQAFVAVGLMTVRQPREVDIPRHATRSYLAGKVVWVTGASSGLGEQLAISAAEGGAAGVILSGRRKDALERVRSVCEGVRPKGASEGAVRVIAFDMAELNTLNEQVQKALECFGRIDTLVLSAGVSSRGSVEVTELDVAKQIMTVNYFGPVGLSKALLAARGQGQGRVAGGDAGVHFLVVNSVQGKFGIAFRSSYAASKHALIGFFDCLRAETAHLGVRVTCVFPGYIRTSLSENALTGDGSKHAKMDPTTAAGRDPREVAGEIWEAAATGREEVVIAELKVKIAVLLRTLAPQVLFKILARRARKEMAAH